MGGLNIPEGLPRLSESVKQTYPTALMEDAETRKADGPTTTKGERLNSEDTPSN